MITVYTDGACSGAQHAGKGNGKGPGGWAAVLMTDGKPQVVLAGYEAHTTNNRMELMAALRGLEALGDRVTAVQIVTDSSYVKNAFTQGWIRKWQANGWISSKGDAVANQDLWQQLIVLVGKHIVKWKHVRGHQSNPWNNLADKYAVQAKQLQQELWDLL